MTESQFEQLFNGHFSRLCNIAFTVLKDEDQAKDVVQQVFIKLWKNKKQLDPDGKVNSYLHKAVINTAINQLEKVKKLQFESDWVNLEQVQNPTDANNKISDEELAKKIKNAVEALPDKCQAVFSLSRYEGMTNQEIVDYLDISVKAVEKHIGKALRELRVSLKPYLNLISIILLIEVGFQISQLFY